MAGAARIRAIIPQSEQKSKVIIVLIYSSR